MKILLIHNEYLEVGGEDIAVKNEVLNLKEKHEVKELIFSNKIENPFKQLIYFFLNKNLKSTNLLKKEIKNFKPDVVYVHNTWFKASTGIFKVLKKYNLNTIIKLHNFRYNCTNSYFVKAHIKKSTICNACGLKKSNFIFNKYYQDSFLKSLLVIRYGKKYFKVLKDPFFKIAVLTNFHKDFLVNLGFKNKIFVFPNYLKTPEHKQEAHKKDFIVYAGRISQEKGIEELIESFRNSKLKNIELRIIGEGPLSSSLIIDEKVKYFGRMSNQEVLKMVSESRAVVSATKLFEGQPNLLCEASLLEVPSIFPKTGGIEEFFPDKYIFSFKQFNYQDLAEKLNLLSDKKLSENIGKKNNDYIKDLLDIKRYDRNFREIVES